VPISALTCSCHDWAAIVASAKSGASLSVYYAVKTTYWSYKLNDISQGQDATPIWIPQLAMCLGTTVFAIAMIDRLHGLLTGNLSQSAEQAIEDHHME
jgi:hypothetical protein